MAPRSCIALVGPQASKWEEWLCDWNGRFGLGYKGLCSLKNYFFILWEFLIALLIPTEESVSSLEFKVPHNRAQSLGVFQSCLMLQNDIYFKRSILTLITKVSPPSLPILLLRLPFRKSPSYYPSYLHKIHKFLKHPVCLLCVCCLVSPY